jgi:hypothetical protein
MMKLGSAISFARHYVEMVVVMFAGMFVLGGALVLIGSAFGVSLAEVHEDAPGLALAGMGLTMTAPMVWWMDRRGHSWAANGAMALAMMLPTLATLGFLATGVITDLNTLFGIEHSAMFPAMLIAMLAYRSEYVPASACATA